MATKIPAAAVLHDRAVRAWRTHCTRNGFVYQEPSGTPQVSRDGTVTLCNVNGTLARFSYDRTKDRLRLIVQ